MAEHLYHMRAGVGAHTEHGHDGQPRTYVPGQSGLVVNSPDPTLADRFPEKFTRLNGVPEGVPVVGSPPRPDPRAPDAPTAGKGQPQGQPAGKR